MNTIEYFRGAMKEMHKSLGGAVKDLTDKQLHFSPLGTGNSIAFTFWHYVRTEDIIIHMSLQNKKPIWNVEGWYQKFGMDPKSQGTGMTAEQAGAIFIKDPGEFIKYSEKVFQSCEEFLASMPEEALEEIKESSALGKRSVRGVIGEILLRHGAGHLGEIWYVKGLQGLKGSPV